MPVCRNWQTTATQNRVEKSVWVRVPPPASSEEPQPSEMRAAVFSSFQREPLRYAQSCSLRKGSSLCTRVPPENARSASRKFSFLRSKSRLTPVLYTDIIPRLPPYGKGGKEATTLQGDALHKKSRPPPKSRFFVPGHQTRLPLPYRFRMAI